MVKLVLEIADIAEEFFHKYYPEDTNVDDSFAWKGEVVVYVYGTNWESEDFGYFRTKEAAIVTAHKLYDRLREECLINEIQDEDIVEEGHKIKVYVRSTADNR